MQVQASVFRCSDITTKKVDELTERKKGLVAGSGMEAESEDI